MPNSPSKTTHPLLLGCFALLAMSNAATAQTVWSGATSSEWNLGANWSNNIPGASTRATINAGSNMPVISTADALVGELLMGNAASGSTSLTIRDGRTLTSSNFGYLAYLANTTSNVLVTGSNSHWNAGTTRLHVGYSGTGQLDVTDWGRVSADLFYVASNGGTGTVNVNRGMVTVNSLITANLDGGGPATISITNGGSFTTSAATLSNRNPDTLVTVNGAGSKLEVLGGLNLGYRGDAVVRLENQASLKVTGQITFGGHNDGTGHGTLQIGNGGAIGTLELGNLITSGSGSGTMDLYHTMPELLLNSRITGNVEVVHNGTGTTVLNHSSSAYTYTGGTVINAGTLKMGTSNLYLPAAGAITVNGGSLNLNGTHQRSDTGAVIVAGGAITTGTFTKTSGVVDARSGSISSVLAGATGLAKSTSGTFTLSGQNTYSGGTTVAAGQLVVDHNSGLGTGGATLTGGTTTLAASRSVANAFMLEGGTLEVQGTLASGGSLLFGAAGGKITGSGTVARSLTLNHANQILAPGNSPGIQTYSANQAWNAMTYQWELNDWSERTAGSTYDQVNILGTLDLSGAAFETLVLQITSLTPGNAAGPLANFAETDASWVIATATGGILGFSESQWQVDTSHFGHTFLGSFSLSLDLAESQLLLHYTAVPEPSTYILALGAGGLLLSLRGVARRRRNG